MVPKRTNQHKPCPPDEDIVPIIRKYWLWGWNDKKIHEEVLATIDKSLYGLSVSTVKRVRKRHDMLGTRQQEQTWATIAGPIAAIRATLPTIGYNALIHALRTQYDGLRVPRSILIAYLKATEPEAIRQRASGRLHRRRFWATGVNDVWAFDQHDKWKRFGILLHLGVEIYSGKLLWLKAWWSNRQPPLITSYYLEVVREKGFTCLVTQSDAGKEANGVANAHTVIRQTLDPTLVGTIQHRWSRKGMNVKPEIKWSVMQRCFSPRFEEVMEEGLANGTFLPEDQLQFLVFRWIAIPWIQAALDDYRMRMNTKLPRADRKKFLPHGVPDHIFERPGKYDAEDYNIAVDPTLIDEVEALYADPAHAVFSLVPEWFQPHIESAYNRINRPPVSVTTLWNVFTALLNEVSTALPSHILEIIYDTEFPVDEEIPEVALIAEKSVPFPIDPEDDEGGDEVVPYVVFSDEEDEDE